MTGEKFQQLVDIMARLRGEEGCPWDIEQTHTSLSRHALEEVYEVIESIDEGRFNDLPGELGDLLLQVVFHAQIAADDDRFTINDVLDEINEKLIRRHPHVFGDDVIETAEEQTQAWEQSKLNHEGKHSAVDGVPKQLPALLRAHRLQGKAAAVGFDWDVIEPVWGKIQEEMAELQHAWQSGHIAHTQEELGDVLFAVVNLSRFLQVEPEQALRNACEKFTRRFKKVEEEFKNRGQKMSQLPLEELDRVWDDVKAQERKSG
ncbi:nucleoside triphosphate pyrophosphohydrolase [candidate division KSB1 bacterium]|nr:nucleoside triphosphate pyrophosphohydrolase [candidate division KSB1 bacterium]